MLTFARVRAIAVVTVLLMAALVAAYLAISRDTGFAAAEDPDCPDGSVEVDLTLPDAPEIQINVYNATDQAGLASQVGENFANRGFDVLERDDDPYDAEVAEVALIRYGPETVGAAHVLQAYFLNAAASEFDIEREGDTVDVVIGSRFRQLATETEVRQAIAALGNAALPEGTCPAGTD